MHSVSRRAVFASVIALALVGASFVIQKVSAQQTATPEQQAFLRYLNINSNLIDQASIAKLMGGCDTNPYQILEQKYKSGGNVQITPRGGGTNGTDLQRGLNPSLACRLVKFFEYAEKTQGCRNIKITSAYRSAQQQADMCGSGGTGCAPAGKSCHQYGLAIDITSSCTQWMRSFLGTKNPSAPGAQQFKLHFPYSGDHIQCIENNVASCSPNTKGCDGQIYVSPELGYVPPVSPAQQFANTVRQALGLQQPQLAQPQTPQQQLPQSQPITNAFNDSQQPNAGGVSDTIRDTSSGTSSATVLEQLAFGTSSTLTTTGTSVPLVINGNDRSVITSARTDSQTSSTSSAGGSITQNTFVSPDLANETVGNQSAAQRLLISLANILRSILIYLQPFGVGRAAEGSE